jgi:hypothetical protein
LSVCNWSEQPHWLVDAFHEQKLCGWQLAASAASKSGWKPLRSIVTDRIPVAGSYWRAQASLPSGFVGQRAGCAGNWIGELEISART